MHSVKRYLPVVIALALISILTVFLRSETYTSLNLSLFNRHSTFIGAATFILLALSTDWLLFRAHTKYSFIRLMTALGKRLSSALTTYHGGYTSISDQKSSTSKHILKLGGYPGGLANDGNTCFMNSVLQSLASSQELVRFLEGFAGAQAQKAQARKAQKTQGAQEETSDGESAQGDGGVPSEAEEAEGDDPDEAEDGVSDEAGSRTPFSDALLHLLRRLNARHGKRYSTYRTKQLLDVMKDAPNRNMFLGYNQEDAQEFYQSVLKQVEKEYKRATADRTGAGSDRAGENRAGAGESSAGSDRAGENHAPNSTPRFVTYRPGMTTGLDNLGDLGEVYVPAIQVDPDCADAANEVYPLRLVTPVDGLLCERIGCTRCGETGGIRYSVTSGLDLTLPSTSTQQYRLDELLDCWIEPETIDGVECNRCSLEHMIEGLEDQRGRLKQGQRRLAALLDGRIREIRAVLAKPIIEDADYERLHTKNMVKKATKIKQVFYSRPPAVLCMHVNRSVFDPRTYMVRKNNARILFPLRLNMSDYVVTPGEVNMDARGAFRKNDKADEDGDGDDGDEDDNPDKAGDGEDEADEAKDEADAGKAKDDKADTMDEDEDEDVDHRKVGEDHQKVGEDHHQLGEDQQVKEDHLNSHTVGGDSRKDGEDHHKDDGDENVDDGSHSNGRDQVGDRQVDGRADEEADKDEDDEEDRNDVQIDQDHHVDDEDDQDHPGEADDRHVGADEADDRHVGADEADDIELSDVTPEVGATQSNDDASSSSSSSSSSSYADLFKQHIRTKSPDPRLDYSLKSVISHFGTHNYGHYIAYRRCRGVWWRISDETVELSSEQEVLCTQGAFMLFYELSSRDGDDADLAGADSTDADEDSADADSTDADSTDAADTDSSDKLGSNLVGLLDISDDDDDEGDDDDDQVEVDGSDDQVDDDVDIQVDPVESVNPVN